MARNRVALGDLKPRIPIINEAYCHYCGEPAVKWIKGKPVCFDHLFREEDEDE